MNLKVILGEIENNLRSIDRYLSDLYAIIEEDKRENDLLDPKKIRSVEGFNDEEALKKWLQSQLDFRYQFHLYSTITTIYSCLEFSLDSFFSNAIEEFRLDKPQKKSSDSNIDYFFTSSLAFNIWNQNPHKKYWADIKLFHSLRVLITHYGGFLEIKESKKDILKIRGVELHDNGYIYINDFNVPFYFLKLVEDLFDDFKKCVKDRENDAWFGV